MPITPTLSRPLPASPRSPHKLSRGFVGAAIAFGALAGLTPAVAPAVASASPSVVPPNALSGTTIPFDAELAAAVRALQSSGVESIASQAAQAILGSTGQLSATDLLARIRQVIPLTGPAQAADEISAANADPLALLKAVGIQPFTPMVAPLCTESSADNPLGLVTAGAGAAAGPWPLKQDPLTNLSPILSLIPGITLPKKLNVVEKGETAYAFVPADTPLTTPRSSASPSDAKSSPARNIPASSNTGMRVAWFNTSTMQGGFADLNPVADPKTLAALPLLSGVRLAPVKTGSGTVLSAVYGTSAHNGRSCYFLPAVGVVNA